MMTECPRCGNEHSQESEQLCWRCLHADEVEVRFKAATKVPQALADDLRETDDVYGVEMD